MLVPFVGYAMGRRFIGYVESAGERLTDLLNSSASILVRETFVEDFADDTVTNLGDGEVERSLLYAVEAGGTRGRLARRVQTDRHRLQVQLGPYTALGLIHARPGRLPLAELKSRGPMIPLSDATIGFAGRGALQLRDVGTLVINRDMVDWVRASEEEALAFPGVPVLTDRA
ncbi:MAG TPA: hypothetical protein VF337_07480 [Candidatus Limnocylindrales bacterium]